ncbi:STT3 domain-containing protein [Hydrogenimonas cancrithermarum]|uniref:Undecaprenyl-diphosphooligosaccharide--protein glycotransferase n=1 Tax=Hydrogenimonas cancrithermarum TaxID=2993563 RepID=A0ABN6WVN7_9BACT|nr:STT3 domain-containing protein [Hydrogenimonas cancrithermarum]BDY13175.1 undecaprenyl-diphosphooligosaccharide--protein glycotransferase [Hydrogenimonas cancrithermarum]
MKFWNENGEEKITTPQLLGMMTVAYLFSIAMRLIWVQWAGGHPEFFWNGQLMINTNDGYYFASGVQKELFGTLQYNPRVPDILYTATTFFTYLAAKLLPFSLDTVILYMPAVVSSLVVIPIILIGRLYNATTMGFFAALLGSIAWSYYNRTMTGYYDTDMFSAMAPMFILYFLIGAIEKENFTYLLLAAFSIVLYPFLYDMGLSIVYAMGLMYMLYMIVFHRKERFTYQSIAIVALALMPLYWPVKVALIALAYLLFRQDRLEVLYEKVFAAVAVLLFLWLGDVFPLIWHKIASYALRGTESHGLHFFQVNATVREAGRIPFELMAKRISGSVPGLFAALIGYILLVIRHRSFILALPLIGIGVFSLWGGLRFTVYAVPVAAISLVYLIYLITSFMQNARLRIAATGLLTVVALWPNVTHIIGYKVPTVFNAKEVAILDRLSENGSEKDYVITWWDYGYPIWYYADKNTLIDGGKHDHDNFIVSRILTTDSQLEAARLARIAVETYVSTDYKVVADTLFKNGTPDQLDPNRYLARLAEPKPFELPSKSRDVYLYLPYRMIDIFPTVAVFSNLDLSTGERLPQKMFVKMTRFKNSPDRLIFSNGISLEKKSGLLLLGKKKVPLRRFVTTLLDRKGKSHNAVQGIDPNAPLSLIFMKSYNMFLLLDESMYNSLFVQLFVLGNYNEDLFELVESSPWAKVYRLKL